MAEVAFQPSFAEYHEELSRRRYVLDVAESRADHPYADHSTPSEPDPSIEALRTYGAFVLPPTQVLDQDQREVTELTVPDVTGGDVLTDKEQAEYLGRTPPHDDAHLALPDYC